MDRWRDEIELLREEFPTLMHGENYDWFEIPDLPLPQGWNRVQTRILVLIPPGYPETPPDNFYVETGLKLADGGSPGGYNESAEKIGKTWGQFSWHADVSTWVPASNPREGHNLRTFITMARKRLSEKS